MKKPVNKTQQKHASSFWQRPATRMGWWAVSLLLTFVLMYILNQVIFMGIARDLPGRQIILPFFGLLMIFTGLVSGFVGLIAILLVRERSWLVWLSLLPGLDALILLLGEFLLPH